MQQIATHVLLVNADSSAKARAQVEDFFTSTMLVRYDQIDIADNLCLHATSADFQGTLEKAIEKNHVILQKFINELEDTGFATSKDLLTLEYGYPSKLLHIITHFIDGFIGVDSYFYNLPEDSHWVSNEIKAQIESTPNSFWLITIHGSSATPDQAALVHH